MKKYFSAVLFIGLTFSLLLIYQNVFAKSDNHTSGIHWGYEGEGGPSYWGDLKHEYSVCKTGKNQSPVDIIGAVEAGPNEIIYDYKDSSLRILNNGHTIQVNYDKGSSVIIDGKKFYLLQFHFHTPSENIVEGKPYDMEAHLVHKSADGQLAVVAIFMKTGKENSFIQTLWSNLPSEEGEDHHVKNTSINANDLMPPDKVKYRFAGSLTTPPCSENVIWNVLKNPVEVSQDQINRFSSIFKMNARPVQPLNGRVIRMAD